MTPKFENVYKKMIQEAGLYGNVSGSAVGPNKSMSPTTSSPQNTTSAPNNYKKINNTKINQNINQKFAKQDFSKEDPRTDPNSIEFVHNVTNNILAGRNVHPSHLANLAGVLETNPNLAQELKKKGLSADLIKNSYLKQGMMGSNANIDQTLETRYKNLFK